MSLNPHIKNLCDKSLDENEGLIKSKYMIKKAFIHLFENIFFPFVQLHILKKIIVVFKII